MAQSMGAMRRFGARSLRMESLERRDLMSVTLVAGTETFKSFEFTAAGSLGVGGTWTVHDPTYGKQNIPFRGTTSSFHGTANFTSRTQATVEVDTVTAGGTYDLPDALYPGKNNGRFSLTEGSITGGAVTPVVGNPYK